MRAKNRIFYERLSMKKIISLMCLVAFCNLFSPLVACAVQVPADTEVVLVSTRGVTSKNPDNVIQMNIKENVIINGVKVFRVDDKATINIVDYEKAGYWGNAGEIIIGNGYVFDAKGNKHKISINKKIEGKEKVWVKGVCCAGLLLWPLLLFGFVKGGEAKITPALEMYATTSSAFKF